MFYVFIFFSFIYFVNVFTAHTIELTQLGMVIGTLTRSRLMEFASKRDKNWNPEGGGRLSNEQLDQELELDREHTSLISKRQSGLMNFTYLERNTT
jgi:hypothetical protein